MSSPSILTLLLAVGMALGFASHPLRADTFGNFTYTDHGSYISIVDYPQSATGAVTIPDSIIGKPVTNIGNFAFSGCSLTSVTIPASVTSIWDSAFFNCSGLTSATFQGNAPTMDGNVFDVTADGFTVYFGLTKNGFTAPTWYGYASSATDTGTDSPLTYTANGTGYTVTTCVASYSGTLVIPSSFNGMPVTTIGGAAFYICSRLTSVTIPSSVTSIEDEAFTSCTGLTSVTIPSSVTNIGVAAFAACTHLTSISIPSNVTNIGEATFAGCGLTSVTIPSSVTNIEAEAFKSCINLTSATFQGNAPTMGTRVFDNAAAGFTVHFDLSKTGFTAPTWHGYASSATGTGTNSPLTCTANGTSCTVTACATNYSGTVVIPSSFNGVTVAGIGDHAFRDCNSLTGVTIPASVTSIGNDAFSDCTSLISATFQGNAPSMGTAVFASTAAGFTVGFNISNTGFTAPTWHGYASSATGTGTDSPLTYTANGTSCTVTACATSYSGTVIIPSSFNGVPVTSIGDQAFINCNSLIGVTIPASVTSIGSSAFSNCINLISATFQGNAPSMGTAVFASTTAGFTVHFDISKTGFSYPTWYGHPSSATGTVMSSPLTYTANGTSVTVTACATNHSGVVVIPTSFDGLPVTSIGDHAFINCNSLTGVIIPASVTSIGSGAFSDCTSLTSATFQGNAPTMGTAVFASTAVGFTVHFDFSNTGFTAPSWHGYASSATGTCMDSPLTYMANGTSCTVTACATSYSGAVIIPSSFHGVPVTSIGDRAFFSCTSLTSATFQGNAPTMGAQVFDNAAADFIVHFDVGMIGFTAPTWNGYPSSGTGTGTSYPLTYTANGTSVTITRCDTGYSGGLVIPDSFYGQPVTSIGGDAFSGGAFQNCTGLTGVTIPASVTNIGYYAFTLCSNLTSMTIPDGVTSIGEGAFFNCSSLVSVTIPASVTSIGAGAFSYCGALLAVAIPDGVTRIENATFDHCSSLINVKIPAGITRVGAQAFSYSALRSVTFPAGVTSIGTGAFWKSLLRSVRIPTGVTSIGDRAFWQTSLTDVIIPAGVTSIGEWAFKSYGSLASATFQGNAPNMGSQVFATAEAGFTVRFDLSKNGFTAPTWAGYPSIGTTTGTSYPFTYTDNGSSITITTCDPTATGVVTIPDSFNGKPVNVIEAGAFNSCSGLTGVTIPASVTTIGAGAFAYCSGLTRVSIGSGVTSIGNEAFYSCSGLTGVTIPAGVTSIGINAFAYCSSLARVTIPASIHMIDFAAFYGCSSLTHAIFPGPASPYIANWSFWVFQNAAADFRVYFDSRNANFTAPNWDLYSSVSVDTGPPAQAWRFQWFGDASDSGPGGDMKITAGDGMSNLVKYALGFDPYTPCTESQAIVADQAAGHLRLAVAKNPAASDVTFTIQRSTDLSSWDTSGVEIDQNDGTTLRAHCTTPISTGEQQFLRLIVTRL